MTKFKGVKVDTTSKKVQLRKGGTRTQLKVRQIVNDQGINDKRKCKQNGV